MEGYFSWLVCTNPCKFATCKTVYMVRGEKKSLPWWTKVTSMLWVPICPTCDLLQHHLFPCRCLVPSTCLPLQNGNASSHALTGALGSRTFSILTWPHNDDPVITTLLLKVNTKSTQKKKIIVLWLKRRQKHHLERSGVQLTSKEN